MTIRKMTLALVAGLAVTSGASYAAPWAGDQINVQLLSPNQQTVQFTSNYIVPGPGEPNLQVRPLSTPDFYLLFSDLGFTTVIHNGLVFDTTFQLIKVTDQTARRIESVQVNPDSTLGLAGSLQSGNNFFQFNLANLIYGPLNGNDDLFLNLDIGFSNDVGAPSPVPAPASLPLLAAGLACLVSARFVARRAM